MDPAAVSRPAEPGTPLFALSPERVNGIRSPYSASGRDSLPASPSEPKLGSPVKMLHSRGGSDVHVHGMVARFNQLEIRDHKEMHKRDEAAVKRAEMAREMAELEARRLRDERDEIEREAREFKDDARRARRDIEEGRERERKVAKRLEVVMEELHRAKDTHSHAQGLYEKEIRRARKEAFKASSALVKLQEELKATRNSLRITQSGFESEKLKCGKREQEAFTAQYQLVGLQEELQKTKQQAKVVAEERDALKTSLKEEEVARIAAEGRIALPVSNADEDDEFASPRRSPTKTRMVEGSDKENFLPPARNTELKLLNEELAAERRRRERAEDTVDFMKMECQFQCCSCRVAELNGANYVHDDTFEREMERIRALVPAITPPISEGGDVEMEGTVKEPPVNIERPATPPSTSQTEEEAREVLFSPTTGTFRSIPSPNKAMAREQPQIDDSIMTEPAVSEAVEVEAEPEADGTAPVPTASLPSPADSVIDTAAEIDTKNPPFRPFTPVTGHPHALDINRTPANRLVRTITTTTTVPVILDSPHHPISTTAAAMPMTPSLKDRPFDREAALAQIRQRRDRARSFGAGTATPRKQMVEGSGPRRDISAPAAAPSRQ